MRRKNDILLKSAFEETFPDLLRFFFEDADGIFDVERGFEFMDKELTELFPELERNGGTRVADMLVKAYSKAGSEKWLVIHIEIQQQNDDSFGRRMFQYFYRIFDTIQTLTENQTAMGIMETINMLTREEGVEEGIEQSKRLFVTNLLLKTKHSFNEIAALAEVPKRDVKRMAEELGLSNR